MVPQEGHFTSGFFSAEKAPSTSPALRAVASVRSALHCEQVFASAALRAPQYLHVTSGPRSALAITASSLISSCCAGSSNLSVSLITLPQPAQILVVPGFFDPQRLHVHSRLTKPTVSCGTAILRFRAEISRRGFPALSLA